MLNRFKFSEITLSRVHRAIQRRAIDYPHRLAWAVNGQAQRNKKRLLELKDRYRGERCYLIANGPSLTRTDLNLLANEYTFGMNRFYLLFNRISFTPSFYIAINELVLEQFSGDIKALNMLCFLNWNARHHFESLPANKLFIKPALTLRDFFETDITHPIASGGTVTFAALQIIYFLGFTNVVIVGLDHRFFDDGVPNQIQVRNAAVDRNHFDPDYFPQGSKWQVPDLRRSEIAYGLARRAYEADGRCILDATPDGACPVFEKVDFAASL